LAPEDSQFSLLPWLVEHGADPHRADANGQTPLQLAQSYGNARAAEAIAAGMVKKPDLRLVRPSSESAKPSRRPSGMRI
jgi:ankyrin repeat protein